MAQGVTIDAAFWGAEAAGIVALERELKRLRRAQSAHAREQARTVARAAVLNLVVYADRELHARRSAQSISDLASRHPSRAIVLLADRGAGARPLRLDRPQLDPPHPVARDRDELLRRSGLAAVPRHGDRSARRVRGGHGRPADPAVAGTPFHRLARIATWLETNRGARAIRSWRTALRRDPRGRRAHPDPRATSIRARPRRRRRVGRPDPGRTRRSAGRVRDQASPRSAASDRERATRRRASMGTHDAPAIVRDRRAHR